MVVMSVRGDIAGTLDEVNRPRKSNLAVAIIIHFVWKTLGV
jgi:hypothetical protein